MNTKTFLTITFFLFALVSCQNTDKKQQESDKNTNSTEQDIKNNQEKKSTTPKWVGSFFGVLPCASCPGINTTITLNPDSTFEKITEYLESDTKPESVKGKAIFKIETKEFKMFKVDNNTYLFKDDKLFMLNSENKIVEGPLADKYILNRKI